MTLSFANDDNSNAPLYYIEVTLSANDGNGFQQLINWNPSSYSSYLNTDCQNHNWQDGAGNLLYSWFETPSATSSSTSVYEWVVLPNGTTTTIYLVFTGTATSSYSTAHTGVQPNYSSTYAQYDNGASVFTSLYQNFAGTSTPTGWSSNGTTNQNNGVSPTAQGSYIYTSSSYTPPLSATLDTIAKAPTTSAASNPAWFLMGFTSTSNYGITVYPITSAGWAGPSPFSVYFWVGNGSAAGEHAMTAGTGIDVYSVVWDSTSSVSAYTDYGTAVSVTTDIPSTAEPIVIGTTQTNAVSPSANAIVYVVRLRTTPSNGTMPTTTFGSVTPITLPYTSALLYY